MGAGKNPTILIAIVVSLGGFLFGFDASVISGVTSYIKPQFELNDLQLGWVVSAPTFSAMFAMLAAGTISDYVGRKKVLIVVAFLYILSAIWSAFAGGYIDLVMARMIGGLAFGAALILAPIYIAEISPAAQRGRMVSIQQLNIVLGFSAAYFSNYFLQSSLENSDWLNDGNIWRWMFGMECIPAIIYFFALFTVPRSPRWLFVKGKVEEAISVLQRIHGEALAAEEATAIAKNIEEGKSKAKARLANLFDSRLTYVLFVAIILGILQQITGVNAIYFYATAIFEQSGVGTNAAFAQAVWVGIINVVFTLVAMNFIDRIGRKPLILIGLAGIALSMSLTAYGFKQASYELTEVAANKIKDLEIEKLSALFDQEFDNDVAFKNALKEKLGTATFSQYEGALVQAAIRMNPILILIGILGFVASFAVSLGPVMWVMLSEMFPNNIRGIAISAVGFINSFTSWLVQFIFPWELANWGNAATYFIYALFAIVGLLIMSRVLPETKGKSLEELEKELLK
ncbi:MAG: sugar porter family MFS transporter [Bacteroidota bacterium]